MPDVEVGTRLHEGRGRLEEFLRRKTLVDKATRKRIKSRIGGEGPFLPGEPLGRNGL